MPGAIPGAGGREVGSPASGFALIEALVAAALIGWILLVGLDFLVQERRASVALVAHRQAMRAVEATLESVRAGAIPLESGVIEDPSSGGPYDITLWLDVEEEPLSDLLRVTVEARYRVAFRTFRRHVETLVWSP